MIVSWHGIYNVSIHSNVVGDGMCQGVCFISIYNYQFYNSIHYSNDQLGYLTHE